MLQLYTQNTGWQIEKGNLNDWEIENFSQFTSIDQSKMDSLSEKLVMVKKFQLKIVNSMLIK